MLMVQDLREIPKTQLGSSDSRGLSGGWWVRFGIPFFLSRDSFDFGDPSDFLNGPRRSSLFLY